VKTDLDRLMEARGFDAIVVMGEAKENHALAYMTNGAAITAGTVVKKQGGAPLLVCGAMEREEAAKSGLEVRTNDQFNYAALFKEAGGDLFEAQALLLKAILTACEVEGVVCFYGLGDPGQSYLLLQRLDVLMPDICVTGDPTPTIFDEAYATKDDRELAAIRSVADRTNRVMGEIVDFIKGHAVRDGRLVKADGSPLTVGDVKTYLRQRLTHYGLADDGETIFAIGRDAGVPHSRGEAGDPLELGKSIIFDLFPRALDSGYYHDMTRTFCLGYAPPDVQRAYDEVMQAFDAAVEALKVGESGGVYQALVCDIFEEHGHPTPRSAPGTEEGYVHSLGHGLGLQIHSHPRLNWAAPDTLAARQVFTIEPGLYYPGKGYGVRVEDTLYVDDDGSFHSLTPFPKDLVIKVE
jgi:Xaa-Pro aminopeptidase